MPDNILFYAVFLSQILLISFYFPRKMLKRISYVFATYPPPQYPRLYPEPIEYYEKAQRNYRNLNVAVLLVGLSLLAVFIGDSRSGEWDMGNFVFPYFMIQFFPMMLLEIRSFKYYRLMRKADSRTTRKAELQPRRLFDFISPTMIGLALFVYFAFIALILYIRQFDFPWFGGYWNIVGVTAGNVFFAAIVAWNMYGKKRDPYQAYEDRKRQIELVVQQMVFMSIAATTFMAIEVVLASLDLRDLQPTVMSLYFQLIAVICLRTLRIDNINFAVYKGDPSEEKTEIQNDVASAHNLAGVGLWVGLGLGLLFGVFILVEGGTVKGFVMGVGIGTVLGMVVGSLLESRRSTSPTV
ncbi:MAG: hypothetical protein OXI23_19325 [Gemmatimonadota bacterium]|nr:hypothetical protein [Gemmatimonadota bacterium]